MRTSKRRFEIRKQRVRSFIAKITDRPRMSVFKSGRHLYVQVIDNSGKIIATASTLEKDLYLKNKSCNNKEYAEKIGDLIGERSKKLGVTKIAFDKGGYKYHGVVKAVADSARKYLEF